jgi:hypothetical protein
MTERIAAWLLVLATGIQAITLWPLPNEVASERIAFWSSSKTYWERVDPVKSENPQWTARAKAESLSRINAVLADPGAVTNEVRLHWGLWLLSFLAGAAATTAAFLAWRLWLWPTLISMALFMWLQQPWQVLRFFNWDGDLQIGRGIRQITYMGTKDPDILVTMIVFNVITPVALLVVTGYALTRWVRRVGRKLPQ